MKRNFSFFRTLSLLLSLLMLVSCIVVLPVAASDDLNAEEPEKLANICWDLDFNKMSSLTDNGGSSEFTITHTSAFKRMTSPTDSTKKVMGIKNSTGNFKINDIGCVLNRYTSFTVEAEMYFAQFPTGNKSSSDATQPNDYPISLITWMTTSSTGSNIFRSFRVDGEGYLCTAANNHSRTSVQLPLKEWFTLSLSVDPSSGLYVVKVTTATSEQRFVSSFTKGSDAPVSAIRLFDGYFKYEAYVASVSVTSSDSRANETREASANYYGYQAKPVKGGTFDLRFLSTVSPRDFSATGADVSDRFVEVGYELTAVWKEDGEVRSATETVKTSTVYEKIVANGESFSMEDGSYIHALSLYDVDASLGYIEFVVRPFAMLLDDSKVYGASTTLIWSGKKDSQGCPILNKAEKTSLYNLAASDDTFIRLSTVESHEDRDVNGDLTYLRLKYVKDGNTYNRNAYVKFSFTDVGLERISTACRVLLRLYVYSAPGESKWTEEELAAGGVMARINGCDANWSEDSLSSKNNYPDKLPVLADESWDIVFRDDEWVAVDVTDYVLKNASDGAVAFMIEATSATARGDMIDLRSSEYTNGPELVVYPTLYNHQTSLDKVNNEGYEPWSYAQALVDEWINDGYKNAYTAGDVQWHVDFDEMTSVADNQGSDEYTLVSKSSYYRLYESPTNANETVLGIVNHAGAYHVEDPGLLLPSYDFFSIEADFYFEKFPYGSRDSKNPDVTAAQSPLNLMRWMPSASTSHMAIRINDHGELCTAATATSGTGYFVQEGEWFTIRMTYDLSEKVYQIYLNDQLIASKTIANVNTSLSRIYLLDGYYKYTAYMKDIRVYTDGYVCRDLDPVDNSKVTGAYNTPINWRANQANGKINSKVYVRSIDSLSKVEGYNAAAAVTPKYDKYGGIMNAGFTGKVTGYFHTEIIGGRTYIIDPLGYPYFAVGMNTVELGATDNQDAASLDKYGSAESFYTGVAEELRSLGINTVYGGDWREMVETDMMGTVIHLSMVSTYMSEMKLSLNNSTQKFMYNNTMNVFDPDFATFCNNKAITVVGDYGDDPRILGWVSDNEITPSWSMLYDYLTVDPSDPRNAFSYAAAWTFLAARTGKSNPSLDDLTPALYEEFKAFVYDRYYKVVTAALDGAGVKQMYLGNRIHSDNKTSEGYLRAASQYVDILTVNLYGGPEPPMDTIEYMYQYSGKPVIVTEFYAKAQDANDMNGIPLMNQRNAGWIVETQEDRAAHYENYVMLLLESGYCVGWTWYRFRDNDQCVYADADGNLYVDHDITTGAVTSYVRVGTLNEDGTFALDPAFLAVQENMDLSVAGDPYLPFVRYDLHVDDLTMVYKGERGGDNSNNGSNKGLYDNFMNIYEPLAEAYKRVDKHIMGLVNYFDSLYN